MSAVLDDLITKAEVAKALHCSIRHVERLLKEGLPFIPLGARKKLYNLTSIKNWLKSRESCLSEKTKTVVGTRRFASKANAYTEYCREAQEKEMLRKSKRSSKHH